MIDEQANKTEKKKPRNYFKLLLKILLYPILGILILNVLLYALLSIPYIQNKAVKFTINKIKPIVNTEVSIDKVQLRLFYHAHIKGLYVETQDKDTLLYVRDLDAQFNLWGLLKHQLTISSVELDDFVANVSQQTPESNFNFQFLIDAFASDSTQAPSSNPMTVNIGNILLKTGRLNYNLLFRPETSSFNPAHICLTNVNADIDLGAIDLNNLDASIHKLELKDKSGFELKNLQASISSTDSVISIHKLQLNLPFSELKIPKADYNKFNNKFRIETETGIISPKDLKPFVSTFKNLNQNFSLQTSIEGQLPQIKINNLAFTYGNDINLQAKAFILDCLHYGTSDLMVQVEKLKISPKGIADCIRLGDTTFVTPSIFNTLGDIRLSAKLKGKLAKLKLNGDLWNNQGGINIASDILADTTFQNFGINAKLYTQNFNLGTLTGNNDLGRISMHADIEAEQNRQKPFSASIKAIVEELEYKQSVAKNILLSAYYDPQKMGATINADIPVGKLNAKVDVLRSSEYNFDVRVAKFKVDRFYKNSAWKNPLLTLHLSGNMRGPDLSSIEGKAVVDSLHFKDDNFDFHPGAITFSSGFENNKRRIDFNSSVMKINLFGNYRFAQLPSELSNLMHPYLPNLFAENLTIKKHQNNFDLDASIQNTEMLTKIFNLPVTIVEPSKLSGVINTVDNKTSLQASFPFIRYGDTPLKNSKISLSNKDSAFVINLETQLTQKIGALDLKLGMKAQQDSLRTNLSINMVDSTHSSVNVDGQINTITYFKNVDKKSVSSFMHILPTDIHVGDLKMKILPAIINHTGDKTHISNLGFTLDQDPYLGVDGTISNDPSDSVTIYFNKSQLGDLLSPFEIDHVKAVVDGKIRLTNILERPQIYTKGLKFADIILFNDTLGTLNIESNWDEKLEAIKLAALLSKGASNSTIDGLIYPQQDSLDVGVNLDKFSLQWLQPFTSNMINKLTGSLSSHLQIKGEFAKPTFEGWIGANNLSVGVDYTNVIYNITDTINVSHGKIGFENLILKDNMGDTAIATAEITHRNFEDPKFKLNLKLNNLMVLNTASRTDSLFYGKVFASGNVDVNGDKNGIDINMKIKDSKNSKLNILIPQTSEASDYRSIVYINTPKKDSVSVPITASKTSDDLPLKLAVNLEVTPDIVLGVVLNPVTGDAMQIKGSGLINFSYDMLTNNMKAFGDYTLTDGSVKLKLQQLSTMDFKIKEGSKVHFLGDPTKSTFDITAYHRVKADLTTLDPSFAMDGMSSTRVLVDCLLGIKGDMQKMNLSYDISLPESSDDVRQKVKSLINTDEQKLKQFAYLIASGTFYSNTSSNTSLTSGLWTNIASSTLSSGLDAVLGNVLGDKWQIGTNIESNDGTFSNMDMSVNVSTKLLNDKLKVNTNVGYRTAQTSSSENSFIGDFDAEYELTRSLKLKVYTKTNDNIYDQSPTTQGIGVVYTKEAKTLKELFHFF